MSEFLENHASTRIQTLNELASLYGETIWLVAQEARASWVTPRCGEPVIWNYYYYGGTKMIPWVVGGFSKHNTGRGLKPFWPRSPVATEQEVFLFDGAETSDRGRALRVRCFNIPVHESRANRIDYLTVNYAMFRTREEAERYRVVIALTMDSPPRMRSFFVNEMTMFRYSIFESRFFSKPSVVPIQDLVEQGILISAQ